MRNRKEELLLKQDRLNNWEIFGTSPKEQFDEDLLIPFYDEIANYGDFSEGDDY